ncbi:MAG: inorganic phosphate transporter [Oleispira antarctica]|uniref:Phosphate transporter n=1 Tax=Oleispira antarctica RB-8 TaxID=698738 RepID=R4YUJ2_OLEAN|nr:inorganic phosphate transporter [Oleispira antarctica]MBQ0791847.1 inorganic phosphate transporter [Oleispira antarctica]CCK76729.1 Phosphate family transporter [Oleispira antarctica RB-8]
MELLAEHGHIFIALACIFGLFMAWGIGANDVANAMGTSVGSKAITIKQAILIAIVFEFAGAFLAGGEVTATIRKGIIDPSALADSPELLVFGMLASLLAAGIWLLVASIKGWPVSTTHSIVGAIVGFSAVGIGVEAVAWGKVGTIAASWIISPMLAGSIAFVLYKTVQHWIHDTENPFAQSKKVVPFYIFLVGFIISMVTLTKGLKHIGLDISFQQSIWMSLIAGVVITFIGIFFVNRVHADPESNEEEHLANVEKVFAVLMVFTACAMAFAHGSNDVANAIGPVAAIYSVVSSSGEIAAKAAVPAWILLIGGLGIVVGLVTYGHKVIATVGTGITQLTPSRGFAATLAAATTVVVASGTGLPISTTHTLVGAILGVGLAVGRESLNYRQIGAIFMSWLVTLPAGAALSIFFFFIFRAIWG